MGLGLAFNAQGSKYTSDILGPVLPGTYTMEVTQAGREWEEPPTIVSIRLLHRQCHPPNCPSTCPADQFEPGKLRGGCNTTAILQNEGQSYVARLVGLEGLQRNSSLTIDFYQNGTNISNFPVSSCDKFDRFKECDSNSDCDGSDVCCDGVCKDSCGSGSIDACWSSSCKASDECSSNGDCSGSDVCCDCVCKSSCGSIDDGVRNLIVSNQMLQDNETLSDRGVRWSTPPMILAYYIDGKNLCDEGVPPCCWMIPRPLDCTSCEPLPGVPLSQH